jgi:hypothetical protein
MVRRLQEACHFQIAQGGWGIGFGSEVVEAMFAGSSTAERHKWRDYATIT